MSSHHVIRDEQEPPIFILAVKNNLAQIKQLLGWSPTVWVLEEHAEWVMSQNIKVDGILSAKPSEHTPLELQSGNYIVREFRQSDIFSSIFSVLEDKKFTGINIFCGASLRNELLCLVDNSATKIPISIFVEGEITLVSFKKHLKKWYPAGSKLKVLVGELLAGNVQKEDEYLVVKEEGFIQIKSESPLIILTEL